MKKITILAMLFMCSFLFGQVQVGSGTTTTTNVPIVSCYGFTYAQQIYYQSEINTAGDITSISFYLKSAASSNTESSDWTIYLGHSTRTEFEATTDWEPNSNLTQVYSGTVTYPANDNWMEIVFDTPFAYNNVDNLVLAIDENQPGYDCSNSWNKTDDAVNRSIWYRNDTTNPDPETPPTATSRATYYANAIFGGLVPSNAPNCDALLTSPIDGETSANLNNGISWSGATGSATGYKVTIGTTTSGNDIADTVDVGDATSYDFPITAGQTYYVTITPYNENGDATGCVEESFTGAVIPECPELTTVLDNCGNFDISLTWEDVGNADTYNITVGTTSGGNDIADNESLTSTSYTISNSNISSTYYVTVSSLNSAGESIDCGEVTYTTSETMCYCVSEPSSNDGSGIESLQVGNSDFTSGGDITYEDFTGTAVSLSTGLSSNVQIVFATGYTYGTNIWIDFNDDFVFEASELVFQGVSESDNPTTLDASFEMPSTAILGTHRMRIGTADSGQATPNPCYNGSFGVTIDLDVQIVEANCSPVLATTVLNPDCDNAQFFVDIDISDLGDGTPMINDGTSTYTPVLGLNQVGPYADGTTISIVIEHGSDSICDVQLGDFTNTCPPENVFCTDAIPVAIGIGEAGDNVVGSNVSDVDSGAGDPSCNSFYNGGDIWYQFTVPAGAVDVMLDVTSSDFSSIIAVVYDNDCTALTEVFCETQFSSAATFDFTSLTSGETYLLRLYDFSNDDQGQITFNLSVPTLGVDNVDKLGFTYFPNPVNDQLTLRSQSTINNVIIYNLLGQEVLNKNIETTEATLDMSSLQSGAYLAKITIGNKTSTVRVLKN